MTNWRLKSLLGDRFGTQLHAAKVLGISDAELSKIVRGHREPSTDLRAALERELGKKQAAEVLDETKSAISAG
jgi:hypothetical protein